MKTMKIGSWNVNGLQCSVKKQTVGEVLETQELSVLGLVETHIQEGKDLSMFRGYWTMTVERGYGEKAGGGIMTLVKDGIKHSSWNPVYPETPGTEKEKIMDHTFRRGQGCCRVRIHGSTGTRIRGIQNLELKYVPEYTKGPGEAKDRRL